VPAGYHRRDPRQSGVLSLVWHTLEGIAALQAKQDPAAFAWGGRGHSGVQRWSILAYAFVALRRPSAIDAETFFAFTGDGARMSSADVTPANFGCWRFPNEAR
jgi:hypothetical protein